MLNTAYDEELGKKAKKVIYTGPIDEFFNYEFGKLAYRSLDFVEEEYELDFYQGCAQLNYTNSTIPYTRIVEHKHFNPERKVENFTIITREYSVKSGDPYYPINDDVNNSLYKKYKEKADTQRPDVIFAGRLGHYQYYDMHQVIGQAMKYAKLEKEKNTNN